MECVMNWLSILIGGFIGFALGISFSLLLQFFQRKTGKELAEELFRENETQKKEQIDAILEISLLMHYQSQPKNFSS